MQGITATEVRRPIEPRMNLDVGRLYLRDVLALAGVVLGLLALGTLGSYLVYLVQPAQPAPWSGWQFVLVIFGSSVAALGFGLALVVSRLLYLDWTTYHQRLQEWHEVALDACSSTGGVETQQSYTLWELQSAQPRDVLLVALAVHVRVQAGEPTPYSVRQLDDCWLGGLRLGDVRNGEQMARSLEQLGLIRGRGQRKAGEWVPQTADEVLHLVQRNWSQVKG